MSVMKSPTSFALRTGPLAGRCFLITTLLLLAGCRFHVGGESTVEAENQRLREELMERDKTINALTMERDELKGKLDDLTRTPPFAPMAGIIEATPKLTRLTVSDRSVITDRRKVMVYVQPRDGRDRFLQIVGELSVTVADAAGTTLGTKRLSAIEVRDAYREGPFGPHYLVEMQLEAIPSSARATATFTEAPLAKVFEASSDLRVLVPESGSGGQGVSTAE